MKKIAIVYYSNYTNWPMGGILNYLQNILPFIAEEFDLDFWGCSVNGEVPQNFCLAGKEYEIKILGNAKTINKFVPNNIRSMYDMVVANNKINSIQYDYIYFHSTNLLYSYKKGGKNRQAKLILHQHGLGIPPTKMKIFLEHIQLVATRKADVVLINSDKQSIDEYVQRYFKEERKKFYQAISPVDMTKFLPSDQFYKQQIKERYGLQKGKIFVYTGRITRQKDPLFVLEAFSILRKKDAESKLLFIGSGDLESLLKEKIAEFKLQDCCFMLGRKSQKELIELLSVCDVFVIASMGEGTSLSIAEALACGVPVVAIDAVGIREFVEDGINGELVMERNVEKFAEAMYRVAFSKYSLNARKSIERASVDKVSEAIVASIR